MHNVKVPQELWWWFLENIPGVHVYVGWQPRRRTDLIQADVEAVKLGGVWVLAGEVMEPDARSLLVTSERVSV